MSEHEPDDAMRDHDVDDQLRELAAELPWDRPDDARREAVRSSLLLAAQDAHELPRTRWRVVGVAFVAGALAAAAVAVIVVRARSGAGEGAASVAAAAIEAPASADYEREVVHDGQGHLAEVVRVHGGTLHVTSMRRGERIQIATADARVEGEGSYDIAVAGDRLTELAVTRGSATLRLRDQQVIVLAAGQTWNAKVLTATIELPSVQLQPPPPAQQPASAGRGREPSPVTAHRQPSTVTAERDPDRDRSTVTVAEPAAGGSPRTETATATVTGTGSAAPAGPSPTEQHFAAGWQLLKHDRPAEAARELGAAADAASDPALAADARYFQAVALTRAGRKTEAEHALVAFLDHAPTSLRRGRAAVMLAKLIAERGDAPSARSWFTSALHDPDPSVAAAARAGLARLPAN